MRAPTRWLLPGPDRHEPEILAAEIPISLPAARVLWRRGCRDVDTARRFLRPSLDDLCDPMMLLGMDRAASRLARAIHEHEKILLYGDYDVDGISSIVILKKAIELAGGEAGFHVPDRFEEGYGMRPEVVEAAAMDGVRLIVSVDTGIRATESVRRARELGVDVVVTDHHLPMETLPPAYAVVNPNQPGCRYPEKSLCGAGVALKLAQALFLLLEWPEDRRRRITLSFLKMVAVATVADVVPLVGENRVIVKHGLEGLRSVRNPGLRALLEVSGLAPGESPSAGQVAFRLAPRINAAGRMSNAADVVRLFLTDDEDAARALARELQELNQERQQAEAEIIRQVLDECARTPVDPHQAALVFSGEDWHRGVVGIVASRLVDRFHRPTVVLSIDRDSGVARGSGRSIRPFHLLDALESMAGLLTKFGGHRQAAGLTLPADRIPEFRSRFERLAALQLSAEDLIPLQELDARLTLDELDDQAAADVLSLAPFGFGNPAALFAIEGVEIAGDPQVFRDKHLRVRLRQNGRTLMAKAWGFADRIDELPSGARLDAAVTIDEDHYLAGRGYPGWSLTLRDVR